MNIWIIEFKASSRMHLFESKTVRLFCNDFKNYIEGKKRGPHRSTKEHSFNEEKELDLILKLQMRMSIVMIFTKKNV